LDPGAVRRLWAPRAAPKGGAAAAVPGAPDDSAAAVADSEGGAEIEAPQAPDAAGRGRQRWRPPSALPAQLAAAGLADGAAAATAADSGGSGSGGGGVREADVEQLRRALRRWNYILPRATAPPPAWRALSLALRSQRRARLREALRRSAGASDPEALQAALAAAVAAAAAPPS